MHPDTMFEIARLKREDYMEEARRDRLANSARTSPGFSLHTRRLLVLAMNAVRGSGARLMTTGNGSVTRHGRRTTGLPA